MKVLIGHDGSECSDAALADLGRAGLPEDTEVLVLCAPDVWPKLPQSTYDPAQQGSSLSVQRARALATQALEEAKQTVTSAATRLRSRFPKWAVQERATTESPQVALTKTAQQWHADLLVVGSHGRSGVGKFLLGSVSRSVLTHAPCSVRIARCRAGTAPDPNAAVRLVLAIDGSENAAVAARVVAARRWPPDSEVKLVSVLDLRIAVALSDAVGDDDQSGEDWAQRTFQPFIGELRAAGLFVTTSVRHGDPKHDLLSEANDFNADAIFLGATGMSRMERFLLGSVSSAVAAHASCSVEVVRINSNTNR